ncbi:MAG: hypothetical protein SPI15_09645 [Candidatus Faecousia sp.]|nr:hypothetical protein [Clostridiales bacterium]MDY6181100.1 hypothetical protein [Candidatus Faecousia sp.]
MKMISKLLAILLVIGLLAAPVCAEGFTPSVEQKGAPELVAAPDAPEGAAVAIKDADGNVVAGIPAEEIVMTSVADSEDAPEAVKEEMKAAYDSVANAASLAEVVPELDKALEDRKAGVKAEDLVVRDLVNVSVSEEAAKKLAETGNNVTLSFKLGMKQDDFLMVMCFVDGQWVILDADQVEILEDGTVNVTFREKIGTIAFVVEQSGD